MKVIIQCAGTKWPNAVTLTSNNVVANFVAHPELAPKSVAKRNVTPDDCIGKSGESWRDLLLKAQSSKSGLMPAYSLYRPKIYSKLVQTYGISNVYILSAGWGLVHAGFCLPKYDITFSRQAEPYKRRRSQDGYNDFCHLADGAEPVVFFGGKDYFPLLSSLLKKQRRRKVAFFRAAQATKKNNVDGWEMIPYVTPKLTNWHYEAARALANGSLRIG